MGKYQTTETLEISESLGKVFLERTLGTLEILGKDQTTETLGKIELSPHEAIRITSLLDLSGEITDQYAASLYKLIRKHTVESCMSEYQSNLNKITITAPEISTNKTLEYNHILEIPTFMGWKQYSNNLTHDQAKLSGQLFHFQLLSKNKDILTKPNYIDSIITVHSKHYYYTESSLIQKLEQLGIGRPSTYAQLVETIQERGYVKCKDVDGITLKCEEYKLIDQILEKRVLEKTFGKEKNKLIIQPIGILCIEFLIKHFNPLFSYDYTKIMEDALDQITDQKSCIALCAKCTTEIQDLIKPVAKIEKQQYRIDENHVLIFNQFGASIKRTISNKIVGKIVDPAADQSTDQSTDPASVHEYLPVKKDLKLDLEKLKKKEYTLDDLLEFANSNLGKYEDQDLFLRIGKYGNYVEWGENKKSISDIGIPLIDINLDDIKQFLSKKEVETDDALTSTVQTEFSRDAHPCNKTILRQLNKDFSIRKGKYGQYIYHKSSKMKNPDFYNIKDFCKTMDNSTGTNVNPLLCNEQLVIDWVIKTNHITQ